MDPNRLFLSVLDELEQCVNAWDEYHLLKVAALLRLLILDEHPLVDQINRRYRIPLLFEVGDFLGTPGNLRLPPVADTPVIATVDDAFSPEVSARGARQFKRDELLSLVVILLHGHEFTVRDVIRHVAYIGGVVHAGRSTDQKDMTLEYYRRTMQLGGLPTAIRTLRAIGRVVLSGLQELRETVRRS